MSDGDTGNYDPESSLANITVLRLDGALCREREAHNNTKRERDEARRELEKMKETKQELMQMVYGRNWLEQDLLKKIDTWRKYAEKLAIYLRAFAPYSNLSEGEKKLLAEFDQLKEGAK